MGLNRAHLEKTTLQHNRPGLDLEPPQGENQEDPETAGKGLPKRNSGKKEYLGWKQTYIEL